MESFFELKDYFDRKTGVDVYRLIGAKFETNQLVHLIEKLHNEKAVKKAAKKKVLEVVKVKKK